MPVINSVTNLDERFSSKVVETLRSNTLLIPGVTYNSDYVGEAAGAISVSFHVPASAAVVAGAIGGDYNSTEYADSVVQVNICNAFRQSKKVRNVADDATGFPMIETAFREATEDVREGRDLGALAAMVNGGTSGSSNELTAANIKAEILGEITAIKTAKGRPDVIIGSPATTALLLQAFPTGFTPEMNEEMTKAGSLGRIYGCSYIENQQLGAEANTAVALNTAIGTEVSDGVDISGVSFIVYDHRFFAMVNDLTEARVAQSENFAGVKANIEDNVGYKVLRPNCLRYHQ